MKRANGEGTFFQRPNGSWSGRATVTLCNGEKKRLSVTEKTKNAARDALQKLTDQERRQIPFARKDWTVADYFDYWMQEIQPHRVRETTLISYELAGRRYIKPTLGKNKLYELSTYHVRAALRELTDQGYSARTQLEFLRVLSSCLSSAMREEIIFRNVAQLVERPKHTPKKSIIWTPEQAMLFLQTAKPHPQYIAFLLLMTYGMRRGEVLGLRWIDVDFESGVIHVRQQIDRINGKIKARDLKTANSRRELPLAEYVRTALLSHAKQHNIIPPPFCPELEYSTQDTIVVSQVGTPLEPRRLAKNFDAIAEKAGLPHIRLHDTRHMAATFLKDLNIPAKDAQLILGHANISTTLNIYQHGTPETQRTAINALENRLLHAI